MLDAAKRIHGEEDRAGDAHDREVAVRAAQIVAVEFKGARLECDHRKFFDIQVLVALHVLVARLVPRIDRSRIDHHVDAAYFGRAVENDFRRGGFIEAAAYPRDAEMTGFKI